MEPVKKIRGCQGFQGGRNEQVGGWFSGFQFVQLGAPGTGAK